uniref:Uncharacterized protein n=1 Tax=Knipowitschia caucasica TaxID=637954 RepID=A0AAV2JXP7_KNICA
MHWFLNDLTSRFQALYELNTLMPMDKIRSALACVCAVGWLESGVSLGGAGTLWVVSPRRLCVWMRERHDIFLGVGRMSLARVQQIKAFASYKKEAKAMAAEGMLESLEMQNPPLQLYESLLCVTQVSASDPH